MPTKVVVFEEGFRKRVIFGRDEEGGVTKATVGEHIDNADDIGAYDVLPSLTGANGMFICEAETFDPPEGEEVSICA